MHQLTFLRHGRSRADDENRIEGRYDSELTATGIAQAEQLAARWTSDPDRRYDRIISSTLRRAAAVARRFPLPSFIGPYDRPAEGTSESLVQLHARALGAVQSVLGLPDGRYLIVGHGGILNAAVRVALGVPMPIGDAGVFFRFGDLGYIDLGYDKKRHRWMFLGSGH